ncbi:hypothetical protein ABMA70_06280 [Halobacteriovorax sp. XZX-3]|uniref:hypothetical protein n=1 Tax=unclassified Halobacteriovorax TaxID=2639665 RepID=UPI000CD14539|nr:hypothetical protein [Halobacteriovorax sp. DA5]POB14899.1 hypothetical protein C0Z22_00565 [Halobacteriovorax sp. DA5]
MFKKIIIICLALTFSFSSFAQTNFKEEGLRDLTTVAGLGLGGAILGLSTLSFVEEPKDHLKNILVGAAVGIVVGVGVVAYNQAAKSQATIRQTGYRDFDTTSRLNWHASNTAQDIKEFNAVNPKVGWSFNF